MRILLDEDVPLPLLDLLRHLLRGHTVDHVREFGWGGKKDRELYHDARGHFDVIVTNDLRQLQDPEECRAIQRSGLHYVSYDLRDGLDGLALATASICAAIRPIMAELEGVRTQRIVRIHSIVASRKRFEVTNPATDPPSRYWP